MPFRLPLRALLVLSASLGASTTVLAQAPAASSAATDSQAGALQAVPPVARRGIAKVSKGSGALPNEDGQVWREYDITPYTLRVTSTSRPEQAVVDWVLRETGYEAWHGEPVALLSANNRVLRVYHTPQMQEVVGELVDRFVNSEAESHAFGLRVCTVGHPNWRARAQRQLQPVAVQSQGVQAWLIAKEDASLLVAELRRRADFREYSSPHMLVINGQSSVVSTVRPRNYLKSILARGDLFAGFEPEMGQVDEGFSLEFSPLLSLDGAWIDAIVKCHVDQVEKMVPVVLEAPSPNSPRGRAKIEVPQVSSIRLHERFRWPVDKMLLISLGMVATPVPEENAIQRLGIPLPIGPDRADLLVFIESKGKGGDSRALPSAAAAQSYQGRY